MRTTLTGPLEDGKHLPEPTWALLGPATAIPSGGTPPFLGLWLFYS